MSPPSATPSLRGDVSPQQDTVKRARAHHENPGWWPLPGRVAPSFKDYGSTGSSRGQAIPSRPGQGHHVPGGHSCTRPDSRPCRGLLRALPPQPTRVYNLGAVSFVAYSWENAQVTTEVTGNGVLNILGPSGCMPATTSRSASTKRAVRRCSAGQEVPQREHLLWPRSPRGRQDLQALPLTINYRESHGTYANGGILFNHESRVAGRSSSPAR